MLYPGAEQRLLGFNPDGTPLNHHIGGCTPRLQITHIMQGDLAGTDDWFHNSKSQVSAHFGVGADGTIYQWVDTDNQAWHAYGANDYAVGVENEGWSGNPLTDEQIIANGKILAWLHAQYAEVSLWRNSRPYTGSGLSWHGLGGVQWGNHPQCPGVPVVSQLDEILAEAKSLTATR